MACGGHLLKSARQYALIPKDLRSTCMTRCLSTSQILRADGPFKPVTGSVRATPQTDKTASDDAAYDILGKIGKNLDGQARVKNTRFGLSSAMLEQIRYGDKEHHLHVYSHKHNTHLTLTDEDRRSLISLSTGNLGFRKAQRGTYDAAYQLMAYLLSRMQQQGIMPKIKRLELCFRGYGQGREAVTKVLHGIEGTRLRESVVRIVDTTRIKIGGTRSPGPRRLG